MPAACFFHKCVIHIRVNSCDSCSLKFSQRIEIIWKLNIAEKSHTESTEITEMFFWTRIVDTTRRVRRGEQIAQKKVTRKARKSRKCFSEHELSIRHAEYADKYWLRRKKGTRIPRIDTNLIRQKPRKTRWNGAAHLTRYDYAKSMKTSFLILFSSSRDGCAVVSSEKPKNRGILMKFLWFPWFLCEKDWTRIWLLAASGEIEGQW